MKEGKRVNGPVVSLLVRADCQLPNGQLRRLHIMRLSTSGAFVMAMNSPPLGADLVLTIYAIGTDPLPPIEARVISQMIHPWYAELSGFDVVFTEMRGETLERLSAIISERGRHDGPPVANLLASLWQGPERRVYPRVATELLAFVEHARGKAEVQVLNLSISGALLALPPGLALAAGDRLELSIIAPLEPEEMTLGARVARVSEEDEPGDVGVQFVDVEPLYHSRLEGLLMEIVAEQVRSDLE